jgi:3-hydroxyisobutyrate dehydrogenase-like beta-hydroxyacid dehydrogenase
MGEPMAANILRAGYPLVVWNRTKSKASELIDSVASWAKSPAAALAGAAVVISSLADDATEEEVVHGKSRLLTGLRSGAAHIGASTISPPLCQRDSRGRAQSCGN